MGTNVLGNSFFILLILVAFIALVFIFTIGNQIIPTIQNILNTTGVNTYAGGTYEYLNSYAVAKPFFLQVFQFLVYLLFGIVLFSTFVNETSIKGYFLGAVAGTIIAVVLSYFAVVIWNSVITVGAGMLDFSDFSAGDLWFVTNIQTIFIIHLFAGLLSFVFVKRDVG